MEAAYARHLGVPASQLVAGRGTTEFIWALSRQVAHASVAVPLPAYTDYLKAFPGRGFAGPQVPTIEHVDAALSAASLVIISNPHNPSGVMLDPAELVAAARRHPHATFVVDESYVDFVPDPSARDGHRRRRTREPRRAALAVEVLGHRGDARRRRLVSRTASACAACSAAARRGRSRASTSPSPRPRWRASTWAERARLDLADDGAWLADVLRELPGKLVTQDVGVHYRCLEHRARARDRRARWPSTASACARSGAPTASHPGALRILAPLPHERETVAGAVRAAARQRVARRPRRGTATTRSLSAA